MGAAENRSQLIPTERTPWLSFAVDSAPEPESKFARPSVILRSRCRPCHAVNADNELPFGLGANDDELFMNLTTGDRNCGPTVPYVVASDADASLRSRSWKALPAAWRPCPWGYRLFLRT